MQFHIFITSFCQHGRNTVIVHCDDEKRLKKKATVGAVVIIEK